MSNYSDLLVKKKYENEVGAQALLFVDKNNSQAVRVEAPEILKEFTDNAYIGRDPEGILYYDSVDDLTGTGKEFVVKAEKTSDGNPVAHVIFYTSSQSSPYAEFIGKDTYKIASKLDKYSSNTGEWKDLEIGSSTCKVQKTSDVKTITFTLTAIKKKATITLGVVTKSPDTGETYSTSISQATVDAKGTIWYRDAASLVKGKYASYQQDRVVFYENDYTARDFTGYFIPVETSNTGLGVANNNEVFADVKWSDA